MTPFTADVLKVILGIPQGHVMTYGANRRGGGQSARRQAGRADSPFHERQARPARHRVINAKGEIAIGSDEGRFLQRALLEEEGVYVNPAGAVDLGEYRFEPGPPPGESV